MVSTQALLDALDGVCYLVDPEGVIRAVGRPGWHDFAVANDASHIADPASVIGQPLYASIQGEDVIAFYRDQLASLAGGERQIVEIGYRCDAPDYRRDLRMSITAVRESGAVVGFLFQSVMLTSMMRPAVGLFSATRHGGVGFASAALPIATICSFCLRLPWPQSGPRDSAEWIDAEDYYRRGGSGHVRLSHGICPHCLSRMRTAEKVSPTPCR